MNLVQKEIVTLLIWTITLLIALFLGGSLFHNSTFHEESLKLRNCNKQKGQLPSLPHIDSSNPFSERKSIKNITRFYNNYVKIDIILWPDDKILVTSNSNNTIFLHYNPKKFPTKPQSLLHNKMYVNSSEK